MGEQDRRSAGHVPRALSREHGGGARHAAEGAPAVRGGARREARDDGRGTPSLDRDPYQDEGGEG